jgi:DNA polymerase-1
MLVTEDNYESAVSEINRHDEIVCDTETTGLQWHKGDEVCGVCLAAGEQSYYFPYRHGEGENLPISKLEDLCTRVLRPDRPHLGFNYGFDVTMLRNEGMEIPHHYQDAQVSAHLLNENDKAPPIFLKMEHLAKKYLDPEAGDAEDELIDTIVSKFGGGRKSAKQHLWRMPASEVAPYGEQDVITTRQLRDLHAPALKTWGLESMYREICEFSEVVRKVNTTGLQLDLRRMESLRIEAVEEAKKLTKQAAKSAGYEINLNSPKQTQAWLELKSTAKEVLEILDDPRAQLLLDYRTHAKADSTYYTPYGELSTMDGILYPNLNITGTISSRMTCVAPNLQQVPKKGERYPVKQVFVARPGYKLVEIDLAQAEICVRAHYAPDTSLLRTINEGLSLHDLVAEDTGLPRPTAKALNLSAQYGIGAPTFSKRYGFTVAESRDYLSQYRKQFPKWKDAFQGYAHEAERNGYVRLFTGRPMHFASRAKCRDAFNRIMQGGVAEMMRIIMTRIAKEVPEFRMLLQVHDSVVGEVPIVGHDEILHQVKAIFEDQPWCSVPITADVEIGDSWGALETWRP